MVINLLLPALNCSAQLAPFPVNESVGPSATNEFVTPVNQRLTPVGKFLELPGLRPQTLALSPDGQLLVTAGLTHELVVVDPATGGIRQRVALPADSSGTNSERPVSELFLHPDLKAQASFAGLVFSPDGSRLYFANVNGDIKVFSVGADHSIVPLRTFPLPDAHAPRRLPEIPAGLTVSADGKRLYVTLNLSNRAAELDAATGQVLRTWNVGVAPYDVAIVGTKLYVSNWGGRRPDTNSVTGPAGRGTLVRVDPVHFIANEGSLSVIDLEKVQPIVARVCPSSGAATHDTIASENSAARPRTVVAAPEDGRTPPPPSAKEILTGIHTCALALSPNRRFLVAANAGSDTLTVIDTRTDAILETIWARQEPGDLFGAQPNAMAFDRTGKTLFVCNGTQNAVAVFRFDPGRSKMLGLIPVGWFPAAITYDPKHQLICVANLKGFHPGPTGKSGHGPEFNSNEYAGSLSLVPLAASRQLASLTRTALQNMRYPLLAQAKRPPRSGQRPCPVPQRVGEPSVFKHVLYIIKENRTYDQVLGDVPQGNGEPSLCVFGERITPNQHKLAREFVLLDNAYCCGARSADGHQWSDSAMATDYMEKSFAGFPRSYPAAGDVLTEDALAYSPAGFVWDNVVAHGKTLRDYGEYTQAYIRWKDPARKGKPTFADLYRQFLDGTDAINVWSEPNIESLRPYIVTNTVGWDLGVPDVWRADHFIKDLRRFEAGGDLAALTLMWLPNDHTGGTKPGAPTPAAEVADNDLALGRIVEAISHSRFWKDTCLFVIEDDPQDGWDHVSAYRTTVYTASAYTKRGQVVHTQYNTTSILRTIELILGLPPMNQMDATATPMSDCFTDVPDFRPFDSATNNIPLDQTNPAPKKLTDSQLRKDAYASARLPLEHADQCPEDLLNRILWRAMRGPQVAYPEWAVTKSDDD